MKKLLSICLALGLLLQSTMAQPLVYMPMPLQLSKPDGGTIDTAEVNKIINTLMESAHVTGLSLGVLNKNEVRYLKAYGFKNKSANQYNDTASSFYGASLSKSLFAFLVMQLVDDGVINLDKPLAEYLPKPLPEYEDYADLAGDERWKQITPRHCLDHTTGFPNWRQFNPHGNKKLEIFFTPGSRYAYSGEGIFLLQFVIEIITQRKLEELAREKIFVPFGMTRTSYTWQPEFEANYASGHNEKEETQAVRKRKSGNAAGSLQTTIGDYSRFMAALLQGKGLSEASKKEMLKPQVEIRNKHQFPSLNENFTNKNKKIQLSYGLGWGLFESKYGQAFFKEGHSDDGWQHYTIAIPDKGYALLLMSNSNNAEKIFTRLVKQLSEVTIPWEWEGYSK